MKETSLKQICGISSNNGCPLLESAVAINEEAVSTGREKFGLNLLTGDQTALRQFSDKQFDLSFTVSVLVNGTDARWDEIDREKFSYFWKVK